MGILATSVSTKVIYAKETTWNVRPLATAGKLLRRVSVDLNLKRQSYVSNEIRSDYMTSDMRLGVRSTEGKVSGEVSTTTYADFWAALTRKDWAVGGTTGPIITISFTATTIVRSAGSFITDGFKVGDLVKVTGAADAANNKQRIVTGITATVLTVDTTNSPQVVAAAGASITVAVAGKKTFVPQTGHLDTSFTFEKFYDMGTDVSEVFTGCKIADAAVKIGVDSMVGVDFTVMGAGFTPAATQYFTNPTPSTTNGVLSGAKGFIYLNGVQSGLVTSVDFTVKSGAANAATIASTNIADIILSRVEVDGSMSVYFMDNTLMAAYDAETEYQVVLSLSGNADEQFVVSMPRVKLSEVTKDDPATGAIVQTMKFTALRPLDSQTNSDLSVIVFQDTTLV